MLCTRRSAGPVRTGSIEHFSINFSMYENPGSAGRGSPSQPSPTIKDAPMTVIFNAALGRLSISVAVIL